MAALNAIPKTFLAPMPATAVWPTPGHVAPVVSEQGLGTLSPFGIIAWYVECPAHSWIVTVNNTKVITLLITCTCM